MKVAIYARVSTNDKDQNVETQLRPLRKDVAGLDAIIVSEFVDRAGADDLRGRREWRQLMELALRRKVDLIVVWKLDRAFRSVVDGATTLQTLRVHGCGIRSLQEPSIDTTTAIGEAMYHITIAWAQLEKKQLTERVKAGLERARAEGKQIGRPVRARGDRASGVAKGAARPRGRPPQPRRGGEEARRAKATLIAALGPFPKGGQPAPRSAERTGEP